LIFCQFLTVIGPYFEKKKNVKIEFFSNIKLIRINISFQVKLWEMKVKHSGNPIQKTTHEAESFHYGLMKQQEHQEEHEWLSYQFSTTSF